jgi:hypothetical protein
MVNETFEVRVLYKVLEPDSEAVVMAEDKQGIAIFIDLNLCFFLAFAHVGGSCGEGLEVDMVDWNHLAILHLTDLIQVDGATC